MDAARLIANQPSSDLPDPGGWIQLAIRVTVIRGLYGDVAIHVVDDQPDTFEIGVTLAAAAQGRGIGTEAVERVLSYLFADAGAHRVVAFGDARNEPVARLLRRIGMRHESHQLDADFFKGEWSTGPGSPYPVGDPLVGRPANFAHAGGARARVVRTPIAWRPAMRLGARPVFVAALLVALLSGGAAVASANEPIQPKQHFIGLVNGSNVGPVVYTVCAGPIWPGRTGPVAGGQNLAVAHVAAGRGYTGLFSQVYAWIVQDSSASRPQQVKFTKYGPQKAIPAAVRVPCDGTGTVEFSSCPYLAPCAAGWVPDMVGVKFVNIAD